jgi:electron transfer flavoprotein alpha subunit
MARILAVAEQRDGTVRRVSREAVTAARTLADALGFEVDTVLLGQPGLASAAAELGRYGADRIMVGQSEHLGLYSPESYVPALADLIRTGGYHTVLFPASAQGKDLAPRVAARLEVPLASDATALDVANGEIVITRPVYGGRVFARVALAAVPRLVSLRPNVFTPREQAGAGAVQELALTVRPDDWRVRIREVQAVAKGMPDVAEASAIVCGGRGMRGPEHWSILEDLCRAIGPNCSLGASRAVVDAGWRSHGEQIGQTGKTVAPVLYLAIGISGAIQHLAGMRTSGTVVAVNKDPDAPIFKVADYGIVGDAFEVVPKLTAEIARVREGR